MGDPVLEALGVDDSDFFGIPSGNKKGKSNGYGKDNSSDKENDSENETYESLQDKKLKAETKKIDINNEKELNNLVERKMVKSVLMAISQAISTNFVNMGRINSPELAALLKCPEKEREINKFLDEKIGIALENVIKKIEKLNEDRVFE